MSFLGLSGRKLLDILQHHPSSIFNSSRYRLPCPPYHHPDFWDRVYKDSTPDDVHEWGGFDLQNGLLKFNYEELLLNAFDTGQQQQHPREVQTSTFLRWMDITQCSTPEEASQKFQEQTNNHDNANEAILLLGCGNSEIGEQMLLNSVIGPIFQIDISPKVIQTMKQRYQTYLNEAAVKRMEFIVDDATTGLTSLEPECIGGCVLDKGLVDVMHCSLGPMNVDNFGSTHGENYRNIHRIQRLRDGDIDPVRNIMDSVHRVLQPSRPFLFFSRSGPEYILRRTLGNGYQINILQHRQKWKDVNVVKLIDLDVLLYKFVKADGHEQSSKHVTTRAYRQKMKRRKK